MKKKKPTKSKLNYVKCKDCGAMFIALRRKKLQTSIKLRQQAMKMLTSQERLYYNGSANLSIEEHETCLTKSCGAYYKTFVPVKKLPSVYSLTFAVDKRD